MFVGGSAERSFCCCRESRSANLGFCVYFGSLDSTQFCLQAAHNAHTFFF